VELIKSNTLTKKVEWSKVKKEHFPERWWFLWRKV